MLTPIEFARAKRFRDAISLSTISIMKSMELSGVFTIFAAERSINCVSFAIEPFLEDDEDSAFELKRTLTSLYYYSECRRVFLVGQLQEGILSSEEVAKIEASLQSLAMKFEQIEVDERTGMHFFPIIGNQVTRFKDLRSQLLRHVPAITLPIDVLKSMDELLYDLNSPIILTSDISKTFEGHGQFEDEILRLIRNAGFVRIRSYTESITDTLVRGSFISKLLILIREFVEKYSRKVPLSLDGNELQAFKSIGLEDDLRRFSQTSMISKDLINYIFTTAVSKKADLKRGFRPGHTVTTIVHGSARALVGRVVRANKNITYDVLYEGEEEPRRNLDLEDLKFVTKCESYYLEDEVISRWSGDNQFYKGRIAVVNGSDSYDVRYDDDDYDPGVTPNRLMKVENMPPIVNEHSRFPHASMFLFSFVELLKYRLIVHPWRNNKQNQREKLFLIPDALDRAPEGFSAEKHSLHCVEFDFSMFGLPDGVFYRLVSLTVNFVTNEKVKEPEVFSNLCRFYIDTKHYALLEWDMESIKLYSGSTSAVAFQVVQALLSKISIEHFKHHALKWKTSFISPEGERYELSDAKRIELKPWFDPQQQQLEKSIINVDGFYMS